MGSSQTFPISAESVHTTSAPSFTKPPNSHWLKELFLYGFVLRLTPVQLYVESNSSQQICWSILPMAKYEMGSWLARRSTHGTNSNFRIQYHNLGLGPFNPNSVPSFKSEFQTYSVLAHHRSPFPFSPPPPWLKDWVIKSYFWFWNHTLRPPPHKK